MKPNAFLRRFLAITGSAALTISYSQAATLTWDNTAGGAINDGAGAWLGAGLWNNSGTPSATWTSGDDAIFGNGGAGGAVTLASGTTVNSLTFNSFTGTYTLGTAGQTITLNNGITMNSGAGAATIVSPITLGAAQSWTNNDDSLLTIGTGAVTNAGYLLTIGGTGNTTVSSAIGGAGGLTKSGSGTLTLSGSNGFSGQLTVANGTLSIGSINNVSAAGTLGNSALAVILGSTGNTGTLSYTGANASSTKRFTFAAGGTGEINVSTGATTLTLTGLLDGSGGLSKTGAGTLTLTPGVTVNQFTGNTVITNGKVALGSQFAMWQSAYDTTGSTGAIGLNVTGQATPWLGGLAGSVNLATAVTGYGSVTSLTLNPQSGSSVSYGGVIANGAAGMTLHKSGAGTQTLTGTNTYSGASTVWAGTLALSGASGTAQNSAFTVRGGTILLDNSTAWADRLNNATALSLGSLTLTSSNGAGIQTETVGATTFAVGGKVTINNGTTLGDQTTLVVNGAVTRSVGAAIDFVGTGGTLGSGANSPNFTATTLPTNTNGILDWATVNGTQWAENNSNSIRAYSGSFFAINSSTNVQNAQVSGSGTLSGARVANSLNLIATGAGQSLSLGANNLTLGSAVGSPGAILKSGTDAYTISGTGQVRAGSAGAGTELIVHVDGGALTISAPMNTAILGIAKGGTGDLILSGTRAGTMSGNISISGGQLEFQGAGLTLSGVVTGAGGLTVNLNAGQTLKLDNNSNSYAGPTIVKGGYLAESAYTGVGLPGGRNQTPNTNTSLIMSNLTLQGGVWYSKYTINKDLGAGPGQVQILAGTSGFAQDASSGGASSLTLDGGRELVWGSTYFNPTVFVHNTTGNSTLNLANGFDLAGSTRTVLVGDSVINTANGISQLGGNIRTSTGTAGFTKTGSGTLLLSGTNTYNGVTTVSSGILKFANQVSLYNNTPASWTAANIVVANTGTLALNVGGTGQFTTGNVTTLLTNLGGANGTSTTGFAAGSSIGFDTTNAAGGTFTVADNIADSSGAGGGAMGVAKLGSNTLVLSGTSNSYSGATVIRGGTLSLTGSLTGNTAISTADNNNGGGGTALNGILNQSAAGVISGATASFTQGSSGTSTLSGNNSYGGGTTLNAGTLVVGHANALGTGTGTIALNGGTIQSNDATARSFTNAVTIGGNFTVGGTGNMTFSNTGASALGASRTITVTNSGVNATFAQNFTGATFALTKAGAGTLTLTGNNSGVTGGTTITGGTLILAGSTALPAGAITWGTTNTTLQFQNDGNLSVGNTLTTSGRNLTRTLVVDRVTSGAAVNLSFSSIPNLDTGTVFNVQKGSGITSGTPTVTFTNGMTCSDNLGGTIIFNPTDVNLIFSGINSGGSGTRIYSLRSNTTGNQFTGVINNSGGAAIEKLGSGTWTLSGANVYTGSTTIQAGALVAGTNSLVSTNGAFGNAASALVLGNGSTGASDAPAVLINGAFTVSRAITVGSVANTAAYNATIGGSNTTGTSTFSGNITLNTTAANYTTTLQAAPGGTVDFTTGTWATNNKAIAIGSTGNTGTVKLSNAISTSGGISLNFGTLELNSAFTSGNMTVSSGTTLKGTGSVAGTTDVTSAIVNGTGLALNGGTTFNSTGNTLSGTVTTNATLASSAGLALNGALSGTLDIGNGNLTGTSGSVSGAATLNGGTINLSSGTFSSTLGVTGGNWNGAGIVTGAVTSSSGTFTIGSGANLTANGGLAVTGGSIAAGNSSSTITGSVNYTSSSNSTFNGVIAGSGNTLTMNNSSSTLTLTGASTYSGATNVTGGTLEISGTGSINSSSSLSVGSGATFRYNSSVALTIGSITNSGGTIAGNGSLGSVTLGGTGSVDPGNSPGILTASATDPSSGLDYNFEMTGATGTLPVWSNATASLNDVLRLTGATPFTSSLGAGNVISVYFGSGITPAPGNVFTGGFFTDNNAAFLSAISSATFQYFVYNGVSGTLYNGTYYDAYAGLGITVNTVQIGSADFSGGTVTNGFVTQFTVVPEPGAALIGSLGLLALLRRRRS